MHPAIDCRGLSKCYRVSPAASNAVCGYRTLRDDVMAWLAAPLRRLRRGPSAAETGEFWSLRDVNFEVQPGEVVGVIGRNGAGKSTLLKILSRITKPTTGRVALRGRVGSLLEVGTGFHPELTGRENIYLNGAVLGMRRREIARKFERIVEFAEIGQFLDTPVKRYSSGMYVRLAFAVAAHLEPEILIVDEVLAVGDMAFQRKCMGRMREVGQSGSTVLFVSHNMPAVEALCTRGILLDGGRLLQDGSVPDVIRAYHRQVMGPAPRAGASLAELGGPRRANKVFQAAALLDEDGQPTNHLPLGGTLRVRLELKAREPIDYPTIGIGFDDGLGQRLLTVHTPLVDHPLERIEGECRVECRIDRFPLAPGDYWLKLALSINARQVDEVERAFHFSVTDGDAFGEGRGFARGVCVAPSQWELSDAVVASGTE